MILNDFHFYSETLDIQTAAYVLLPEEATMREHKGKPLPTLYLLHGLSDDYTMWLRNTRITQFAKDYYMAVVMPAVNRSFYTDMAHGATYWTFVSEELPRVMETYFPLSKKREERFAAGLSMGGYGAMKLGLRLPKRYAAVASLSGALMMQDAYGTRGDALYQQELVDIFGDAKTMRAGKDNLVNLAEKLDPAKAPRIYIACGTEDSLYPANVEFVEKFGDKFDIEWHSDPGNHKWSFWDEHIAQVIEWLPLEHLDNVW